MYKILEKQRLSDAIVLMTVEAPHVARSAKPGQFVIVIADEQGERIPLTIADHDKQAGTITLVIQEIGKSTKQMGAMAAGEGFYSVAGPLGHPTEIERTGTVVCVAGGVGIAPMYPIARALKEAGNHVISIIGARNQGLLFWEDKMRSASDELIICTDDGSYGRKAVVTAPLKELLEAQPGEVKKVWAIGPTIMMKFVSLTTQPFGVGGCRVPMTEGAKFVCVDGPEFNGHAVDWNGLLSRMQFYRGEEQLSVERWEQLRETPSHECNLDKVPA